MGYLHTVLADVELFATFAIPEMGEADLGLCRIRAELVCGRPIGLVLRQSDYRVEVSVSSIGAKYVPCT